MTGLYGRLQGELAAGEQLVVSKPGVTMARLIGIAALSATGGFKSGHENRNMG